MANTGPIMKEEERQSVIPRLAGVSQAELDMVLKDIAALKQYSATALPANATALLAEVAAIMKGTGKVANYNTAWFGDQAMKALGNDRLDIAMMAITIGLGSGMPKLNKQEQAQIAGIITMTQVPGEAALRKISTRLEIAIAQGDIDDNSKVLGADATARTSRAAEEAQRRLEKGDMEGATRLISMDRTYLCIAVAAKNWAGRSSMDEALDAEIAGKNGSPRFQQGLDELGRQGRIAGLISQQAEQNKIDIRMAGGVKSVVECLKLAGDSFDRALKAAQEGDFKAAKDAYTDAIRQRAVALAMYSEVATYGPEDVIASLGALSGMADRMKKEAQGPKIFAGLAQDYGEDRFGVARLGNYERMNARLFDLVAGRIPAGQAAAEETAKVVKRINDGILIVNSAVFGMAPMGASVTDKEKRDVINAQNTIFKLVALNSSGWIDKDRLDQATNTANGMLRVVREYKMSSDLFSYAGGMMLFPMGLPWLGTGIFGIMSADNIMEEYRHSGYVTPQAWVWGGLSILPILGIYGGGSQLVRIGVGGVMAGATVYSLGTTISSYKAAIKEADPEKRHDLWINAVYSTIYLLPAVLMLPGAYRYAKGAAAKAGAALDDALQEIAPIPPRQQLEAAMQPIRIFGYGISGKPVVRTPGGGLAEAPIKIEGTPQQLQELMRPKQPNVLIKTVKSIGEHITKSREKINKSEPPSVEEFSASTGKVIAEMMDKSPGNIVEVARVTYRAAREARGREDENYWAVLRRCLANEKVRGQLVALAQTDPEIAELVQFTDATIALAAKNMRTDARLFMRTVSDQTRTQGMPANEALTVIESLEKEGARRGKGKLQMTQEILGVETTASDRAALLLNLEGRIAMVGKKQVVVVSTDVVLTENAALRQYITGVLMDIKPTDRLAAAFMQDLMAEVAAAKNFDSAVLAALNGKNFTRAMTAGAEAEKLAAAMKGGNMEEVKAALPAAVKATIEEIDKTQVRDCMLATDKLSARVSDITNGVNLQAGGLAAGSQAKTVFGVLWDWTKGIAVTKAWPAIQFIEWGYGGAIMKAMPGTRLRAAFRGGNIIPFIVQGAAWYAEGNAVWNFGLHPLYNMLTQAGSVEEGRKAAYDRFLVSISRENAIFARSDDGRQFMLYLPNMFPKGSERRPTNEAEVRSLLDKNDIIFEMNRIDDALSDGRQMSAALPRINSLLASGDDAQLQALLTSMGISLADAKALFDKNKRLDIRDMADLRMNDWVERGVACRFRNVVANTLCYDLGMDEATATKDAKFLAKNTDAFLVLWNEFQNGNLPGVWLDSAIDALSASGVMESLRKEPDFRIAAIAKLQEENTYLKVPIRSDSFLSVLDERPYGMPGARAADVASKAAFKDLLDKYRDNPQALARFNAFIISSNEDVYGDANRLAAIISGSSNTQEVLATARRVGLVAPAALALKDASLLKPENAELVKFVVEHSSRDETTYEVTQQNGVYAWFMDNQPHILNAKAILEDLSRNKMAAETSPNRLYTPKSAASYLTGQEQYFQSKKWWIGWAPPVAPKSVKGMKAPPAPTETEAAARKKEMERRYPRSAGYVPRAEAVETGPKMSDEALAFYASPVATTLDKLLGDMKLDDAAKENVYGMLSSTNPRHQAALRLATIKVERDANGAITAVNVQDSAKAKQWLKSYLK